MYPLTRRPNLAPTALRDHLALARAFQTILFGELYPSLIIVIRHYQGAPAAARPTSLFVLLALPFLALQLPYLPAHTSDTTSVDRYKDEKKGIYYVVIKKDLEDMEDMLTQS